MRKEFQFKVKGHDINVVNSWIREIKLYVDGDFSDQSRSFFANGKIALLSASIGDIGILEIYPVSTLISVEIDAYLIINNAKQYVYSSHKRLSLAEQRTAQ